MSKKAPSQHRRNQSIGSRSTRYGESGYVRRAGDFYPTPEWVTDIAIKTIPLVGSVWEPACGRGHMVRPLRSCGRYSVIASDINESAECDFVEDLLKMFELPSAGSNPPIRTIATNPPHDKNIVRKFIERALDLTAPVNGMVVMLLPSEFDCAVASAHLLPKLARKIVITKRIRWFEGTKRSPRNHHAWYVWDHTHVGPCSLEHAYLGRDLKQA